MVTNTSNVHYVFKGEHKNNIIHNWHIYFIKNFHNYCYDLFNYQTRKRILLTKLYQAT